MPGTVTSITRMIPAVCALALGAPLLWLLGHRERAVRREREAMELARRLGHAPSLAHALWFVGECQVARGDVVAATARELLVLCDEHKLPQPRATALMFLGWVLARTGDVVDGSGGWKKVSPSGTGWAPAPTCRAGTACWRRPDCWKGAITKAWSR